MNQPSPNREEALFAAALAMPEAERDGYLRGECGEDEGLYRRLTALLRADSIAGDFLEPVPEAKVGRIVNKGTEMEEKEGDLIDRYQLLQRVGEGGCGVVFMAEQQQPIRRRVALKVIKLGMDTREVIARFEAERQVLAMMDHPNIARVYDAGTTKRGRPYFVMELVRGQRITEYCDRNRLSLRERLRLFIEVCHAVQHAHQKGIIHRDLKPSNVLVTLQDGEATPKIIDFGIAKAAQGRLTDRTFFTAFEQFIGTPEYMSPEQAEFSSQDVDTRSDIYSLGVLLYELLTGRLPLETKDLLKAGVDKVRQHIREVEPSKPSARLRTLERESLTGVAKRRCTEAGRLIQYIHGDLDWIVMRCLEKRPSRRYPTANALVLDLERLQRHEPVEARPPSAFYGLGKFVLRNRLAVTCVCLLLVMLVSGLVVSLGLYSREREARERAVQAELRQAMLRSQAEQGLQRAQAAETEQRRLRELAEQALARAETAEAEQVRQRREAEQARDSESRQRVLAEQARAGEEALKERAELERHKAEVEGAKSRQVARFLTDMMQAAGPSVARGRDTALLREILDQTANRIGADLEGQPEVEASLRVVLGGTYLQIGDATRAEQMLLRARELWHGDRDGHDPIGWAVTRGLGGVAQARGDFVRAEARYRQALEIAREVFASGRGEIVASLNDLSVCLYERGDLDGAEAIQQEAVTLLRRGEGADSPHMAELLNGLAVTREKRGDIAGAIPLLREAVELHRRHGADTPAYGMALMNLAWALEGRGDGRAAEELYREALATQRRVMGSQSLEASHVLNALAGLLAERGDLAMAEGHLREALAIQERVVGRTHPHVAATLSNLGLVLYKKRDYKAAEACLLEALQIRRQQFGGESQELVPLMKNLADVLQSQGGAQRSEAMLREALAMLRRSGGEHSALAAMLLSDLASHAFLRKDWPGAERLLLESLRLCEELRDINPVVREIGTRMLAEVYASWSAKDSSKQQAADEWDGRRRAQEREAAQRRSAERAVARQDRYPNLKLPDAAVIKGFNERVLQLFKEASVTVVKVDGSLLNFGLQGTRDIYLQPGVRQITLGMSGNHGYYVTCAKETVEYAFQGQRQYRLTGRQAGKDFELLLWDETEGADKRVLLRSWHLTGSADYWRYVLHLWE